MLRPPFLRRHLTQTKMLIAETYETAVQGQRLLLALSSLTWGFHLHRAHGQPPAHVGPPLVL